VVFIDDISIYSRTPQEHNRHLRIVLEIPRENELYAKLKKCEFCLGKVAFLGYVVSHEGVSANP